MAAAACAPVPAWQAPRPPLTSHPPHLPRSVSPRSDCGKDENWTCITFYPDLERFGMAELEEETVQLMRKRVYDMAGILGKTVKVGGRQGWLVGWSLAGGQRTGCLHKDTAAAAQGRDCAWFLGSCCGCWLLYALLPATMPRPSCRGSFCSLPAPQVYLNGTRLKVKTFQEYVEVRVLEQGGCRRGQECSSAGRHKHLLPSAGLVGFAAARCPGADRHAAFVPACLPQMYLGPKESGVPRVYERFSDRWEVCVATTEGQFNQVGGCRRQRGG